MEPLFAVLLVATVLGVTIAASIAHERKRMRIWGEVAERLGLQFEAKRIHGRFDDVSVQVVHQVRGSGKNRSVYTVFTATLDGEVPEGLDLAYEGIFRKLGKVAGMQDIHLDLPDVDDKLMVRATDPDQVRSWARRADISRALVDLVNTTGATFRVNETELTFEVARAVGKGDEIESRVTEMARIARALSGRGYGALIDDGQW